MLIIPIGHEDDTVRRLPWVTFSIMAVCFTAHIFVSMQMSTAMKALEGKLQEFLIYLVQHPYLEPDKGIIIGLLGERNAEEFFKGLELLRAQPREDTAINGEEEQARFDQLTHELAQTAANVPTRQYGFISAHRTGLSYLTYMFIHSGWLHLLGNLLFLYLTGPFIEDVWGRPFFIAFYLAAGAFSAFMFGQQYPLTTAPLIGASGAIAGVMGAFLVRYFKTRMRFFYFIFFFVRGTFNAPAFIMLPLWFFLELFNAGAMDIVRPGGGGGVAHWAHVWGFAFGFAVAVGMKALKVEEKYIHPRIEAQITHADPVTQALEDALRKKQGRRIEEAFAETLALAQGNPGREDVIRVLWELAVEMGREKEAAKWATAMIEREIRREQMDAAADDFRKFRKAKTGLSISPAAKVELARYLMKANAWDEGKELLVEALGQLDGSAPAGLLLGLAEACAGISPALARKAIELCLRNSEIPAERKDKLREYVSRLPKPA